MHNNGIEVPCVLLLQFHANSLKLLQVFWTCFEDMLVVSMLSSHYFLSFFTI